MTDRITLMVIPRASRQIHSFRIPVGAVYGGLALVLAGVFVTGHALLHAAELSRSRAAIARLNDENGRLSGELVQVRGRLDSVTDNLAALTRFEEKIRAVAALDPIDEETRQVGIGGPSVGGRTGLLAVDPAAGAAIAEAAEVHRDVETLARQTRLLRESYGEVLRTLESKREELARTPSVMPLDNCWLTDRFGYRYSRFTGRKEMHWGQDFSARKGEPIIATADGAVRFTGRRGRLGLAVEIDHGNGIVTRYGHCHRVFVKNGQEVVRGQVIAAVGSSGRSTNPHLHYEVVVDGRKVDPLKYVIRTDRYLD